MVPAAILFDLNNGGNKDWGDEPPYNNLGIEASTKASEKFELGNVGAGYGAKAGSLKGGLGSASFENEKGLKIGGLFAVNSFGSVVNYETGQFWGASDELNNEFGGIGAPQNLPEDILSGSSIGHALEKNNTTIGIVATNARLDSESAKKSSSEEIAKKTLDCLKKNVPSEVTSIAFLSGGQSEIESSKNLNEINKINDTNFLITFSYGRGLQASALKAFGKDQNNQNNIQKAFDHRAKMNGYMLAGRAQDRSALSTGEAQGRRRGEGVRSARAR